MQCYFIIHFHNHIIYWMSFFIALWTFLIFSFLFHHGIFPNEIFISCQAVFHNVTLHDNGVVVARLLG